MTSPSPIIILSGHRTGSSAVAGLMHLSGLHMGDLLPASPDNPRGYFETREILQASRMMLARRTRDWTCPPLFFEPSEQDLESVETVLAGLAQDDGRWGFKDPRTLFLLPAWLHALPNVTLIGVRRSVTATAKSINSRDRIDMEEAIAIATLYDDRLHQLHQVLGFPMIDFGTDMTAIRSSVRDVVDQLDGLLWDEERTSEFLDVSLVHHEGGASGGADDSDRGVSSIPAAIVTRALNALDRPKLEPGRVHGPSYRGRLQSDWIAATSLRPETGRVLDLVGDHRVQPPVYGSVDATEITIEQLQDGPDEEPASHIVATDVLERIAPQELLGFLDALAKTTDSDGVAVISGYIVDGPHLPPRRGWPDFDVTMFRDKTPFFHHRSSIEAALLNSAWYLGEVTETPGGRTRMVLVKSAERQSQDARPAYKLRNEIYPQLEREGQDLRSRIGEMEAEQGRLSRALASKEDQLRAQAATHGRERDQYEARLDAVRSEVKARREADAATAKTLSQVREQLGRVTTERDQASSRNKALGTQTRKMRQQRDAARRNLQRLRSRRVVRMALGIASVFRPIFRFIRGFRNRGHVSGQQKPDSEARSAKDPSALAKAVNQIRPEAGPASGPLVSIVVTTRNGRHHLERLVPGLENNTNYRSFELIIVDNGSSDGTADYLTETHTFPIQLIRNEANRSFSAANNQGIAAAEGDLVLLLNNDIEPIAPGWLGAMVEELGKSDRFGAVGALLIYSDRPESSTEISYPPLTVQHRGISFGWRDDHPWAKNLGGGEDPTDPNLTGSWNVPAATAACLLARRKTLTEIGLLDEGYTYGSEDVDLCLKMREAGLTIRLCGNAALFHHEFGTQDTLAKEVKRINRTGNARRFVERWSPQLRRSVQSDALGSGTGWGEGRKPTVAITLTEDDHAAGWGDWYTAHELGDAFEDAGWEVIYAERYKDRWYELADDLTMVVSLLDSFDVRKAPRGAIKIAWVRNWVERWLERPWFEHFDEIATSSSLAAAYIAEETRFAPHLVPIATNPTRFAPGAADPTFESDFVFTGNFWGEGRSLIDQLLLRPSETFLLFGKGWDQVPRAQRYWRGQLDYDRLPSVYRSAKIVLDDTASPTLPHGFLNSRVFDALASGALVITDNQDGSDDLFGGDLPAYGNRQELRELMDKYREDDILRQQLASRLRKTVVEHHTYAKRATEFARIATDSIVKRRVAFKIGPPTWDEAANWGDTHFATQFARALGRRGWNTELHVLAEWDDPARQDVDVVVHLRGLTPYVPKPAHFNIMWIISHPDDVSVEECERYDLILVASQSFAEELKSTVSVPVHTLLQATDTDLFKPTESTTPESEPIVFVGNSRGEYRKAVKWAGDKGIPVEVYGGDWDDLLGPGVSHGTVPNAELPALYQSAAILLNDHWDDMAKQGFVSNRIFDALACGAFVVSDHVAGMDTLLGEIVPTYDTAEELEAIVERYATDPEAREALTSRGAALVRANHSFAARADEFIAIVKDRLSGRRIGIEPESVRLGDDHRQSGATVDDAAAAGITTIPPS